jgi:hypothetical protein
MQHTDSESLISSRKETLKNHYLTALNLKIGAYIPDFMRKIEREGDIVDPPLMGFAPIWGTGPKVSYKKKKAPSEFEFMDQCVYNGNLFLDLNNSKNIPPGYLFYLRIEAENMLAYFKNVKYPKEFKLRTISNEDISKWGKMIDDLFKKGISWSRNKVDYVFYKDVDFVDPLILAYYSKEVGVETNSKELNENVFRRVKDQYEFLAYKLIETISILSILLMTKEDKPLTKFSKRLLPILTVPYKVAINAWRRWMFANERRKQRDKMEIDDYYDDNAMMVEDGDNDLWKHLETLVRESPIYTIMHEQAYDKIWTSGYFRQFVNDKFTDKTTNLMYEGFEESMKKFWGENIKWKFDDIAYHPLSMSLLAYRFLKRGLMYSDKGITSRNLKAEGYKTLYDFQVDFESTKKFMAELLGMEIEDSHMVTDKDREALEIANEILEEEKERAENDEINVNPSNNTIMPLDSWKTLFGSGDPDVHLSPDEIRSYEELGADQKGYIGKFKIALQRRTAKQLRGVLDNLMVPSTIGLKIYNGEDLDKIDWDTVFPKFHERIQNLIKRSEDDLAQRQKKLDYDYTTDKDESKYAKGNKMIINKRNALKVFQSYMDKKGASTSLSSYLEIINIFKYFSGIDLFAKGLSSMGYGILEANQYEARIKKLVEENNKVLKSEFNPIILAKTERQRIEVNNAYERIKTIKTHGSGEITYDIGKVENFKVYMDFLLNENDNDRGFPKVPRWVTGSNVTKYGYHKDELDKSDSSQATGNYPGHYIVIPAYFYAFFIKPTKVWKDKMCDISIFLGKLDNWMDEKKTGKTFEDYSKSQFYNNPDKHTKPSENLVKFVKNLMTIQNVRGNTYKFKLRAHWEINSLFIDPFVKDTLKSKVGDCQFYFLIRAKEKTLLDQVLDSIRVYGFGKWSTAKAYYIALDKARRANSKLKFAKQNAINRELKELQNKDIKMMKRVREFHASGLGLI